MLALLLVAQIAFDCVGPHAHRARVLDIPLLKSPRNLTVSEFVPLVRLTEPLPTILGV